MNISNVAIHVKSEHKCGRMLETIFQVKDAKIEGFINTQYPEWPAARSGQFTPHVEPGTENKLELSGSLGGVEFTTCICHLSIRARVKRWLSRLLNKEQGQ